MAIRLKGESLDATLERAFLLAASDQVLPKKWLDRAERLSQSPSVSLIAAFGAALLAKATDARVDSFVIKAQDGSPGAYSLRGPARKLAMERRRYGFDIGSTSDHDPINASTLLTSKRWDQALGRITGSHKPFFQLILRWLGELNDLSESEATEALAAFIRVRRRVAPGAAAERVPLGFAKTPALSDLIETLESFCSADSEGGARGMALVAAAFRAAGYEAGAPKRNDPRRIDVPIKLEGKLVMGSEVKQQATGEAVADTLARDCAAAGVSWAVLAVLPPGGLEHFDIPAAVGRAEHEHGVVLRVLINVRQVLHEASVAGLVSLDAFCDALPRAFANALREIRADDATVETWAAISARWI